MADRQQGGDLLIVDNSGCSIWSLTIPGLQSSTQTVMEPVSRERCRVGRSPTASPVQKRTTERALAQIASELGCSDFRNSWVNCGVDASGLAEWDCRSATSTFSVAQLPVPRGILVRRV